MIEAIKRIGEYALENEEIHLDNPTWKGSVHRVP